MFSKSKPAETVPQPAAPASGADWPGSPSVPAPAPLGDKPRAMPSVLAADLTITGNVKTSGDIQVEGVVEGDIRAAHLTVGESATIRGEVVAEDIVVNGRVVGRLRGLKIKLTASARVEGDIVHKLIAIESGAHFEGSVQRQDDPIGQQQPARLAGPRDGGLREAAGRDTARQAPPAAAE